MTDDRKVLQQKVLEILEGRPKYVSRESFETKLNAPYPSGVAWHYGPVDWRITKKLRENNFQD
jgi:hypothetical protein